MVMPNEPKAIIRHVFQGTERDCLLSLNQVWESRYDALESKLAEASENVRRLSAEYAERSAPRPKTEKSTGG